VGYSQVNLLLPIDASVGTWFHDANDYYYPSGGISFVARDVAKFGLLYLQVGE